MTLALHDVSWSAGGALIIDGVSVDVADDRMVGLIGPNGSGKSTLLRCAAGLRRPHAGSVRLDDADLVRLPRRGVAQRVTVVDQDAPTDVHLSVLEVVLLGRTPHLRALEPTRPHDREVAAAALRRTGLSGMEHRAWPTLSGGERQRARLARALAQEPDVLLLDEPTNHLDIAHQLELLALIRDLRIATLVALHDLNLAARFCDELVVLHHGRLVASGDPTAVLTPDLIRRVYDVECAISPHPTTGTPHVIFLGPSAGPRTVTDPRTYSGGAAPAKSG